MAVRSMAARTADLRRTRAKVGTQETRCHLRGEFPLSGTLGSPCPTDSLLSLGPSGAAHSMAPYSDWSPSARCAPARGPVSFLRPV